MARKTTPLIKSPDKQQTENFKRPNHPDFWTTEECKKNKLSGIRQNKMMLQWEFWILGEVVRTVHFREVAADPYALTKAHLEVFHMVPEKHTFKH